MSTLTHVQLTVCRAKDLLVAKGKSGNNSSSLPKCSVKVSLGKENFQTRQVPHSNLDWDETCELSIPPGEGHRAIVALTILCQNSAGIEESLGVATLPLSKLAEIKDKPQGKWFLVKSDDKAEKKKSHKNLGEVQVKVGFSDRPILMSDLSKKPNKESQEHNTGRQSHRCSGHNDDPIVISDSDDAESREQPPKRSKRNPSESSSSNEASAPRSVKILIEALPQKKRTFSSSSDRSNSATRSIPKSSAISKSQRGTNLRQSLDSALVRQRKREEEEFDPESEMYSRPNRRPDVRSSGIHDLKDCLRQRARWPNKDEVVFIS